MSDSEIDVDSLRANPDAIAAYLTKVLEKNDLALVLQALQRVLRAQNVKAVARASGMRRENLYKTFDGEVDPRLSRVMALANALGVNFTVKALPPREAPGVAETEPPALSDARAGDQQLLKRGQPFG